MSFKELLFGGGVKDADGQAGAYKGSAQEWLPIKNIVKGMVVTKDHRFLKVLEVMPVNFYLKSPTERQNIIYYFANWLKIAPDNLQIRVLAQKADLEDYVTLMKKCLEQEENEDCKAMIEDNIREISQVADAEAITHRFFLIFQYEPKMRAKGNSVAGIAARLNEEADNARRFLDMCGLELLVPDYEDNTLLELLYELINKQTSRHVKLPDGIFDMLTTVHGVYE